MRLLVLTLIIPQLLAAQNNLVTYAGGSGNEVFNDVVQISNGHFLVLGAAADLDWIAMSVPRYTINASGISNGSGTNKFAFILEFDNTLQTMLAVHHLPQGAAEDLRFIKLTNVPGTATGDMYVSGNTEDLTHGGYFIGRLNNNFVNGAPTAFEWVIRVKADPGSYPKTLQPWDVGSDGKVVYAWGDSHAYNWSAIYRNKSDGTDDVVPNWRIHWPAGGGEYYGAAAAYPDGGISGILYSAIVIKRDAVRCDLRSPTQADYDHWGPDGNGGTKKGKWPLDILYNSPCLPGGSNNTVSGPGYTGYSGSATFTHGASSICIDRRTNHIYIGINTKSVTPSSEPDFEPAVMAMDADGTLLWWSRLYPEMTPGGELQISEPDQYVDALAIDYSQPLPQGRLVVNARCHGNNVQNLWKGNAIAANPGAQGFQNNFTGTFGNIHLSWLGKLTLNNGTLMHSTYVGELFEGTGNLGTSHPDPNMDGWPNPNTGWPDLNTTYLGKNNMKVSADGSVIVLGKGRRTITTANAFQKMVKPYYGGLSCWNDFARVYTDDLSTLKYSSLLVGQWDTLTQAGGSNVELKGVFKTAEGIVVVGKHVGSGAQMPTANIPEWGTTTYAGESAVLAWFKTPLLNDPADDPTDLTTMIGQTEPLQGFDLFPNPATDRMHVILRPHKGGSIRLLDMSGRTIWEITIRTGETNVTIPLTGVVPGAYLINWQPKEGRPENQRFVVQ